MSDLNDAPKLDDKRSFLQRRAFVISMLGSAAAGLIGALVVPPQWLVAPKAAAKDPHAGHDQGGQKVYWACPMLCTRVDKPGKCPVCGMDLEQFVDTGDSLPLNERDRAAMGIRTEAPVARQLAREIRTLGSFTADEARDRMVSAWVSGRIDRLYADFTGMTVSEGDHMFDLYSPDLYAAHRELQIAQEAAAKGTSGAGKLVELAREKLRRMGLTAEQLAELEKSSVSSPTFTITAPISGVVMEKMAREGQYIEMGMPVYRVADLSRLWLMLSVHERDLPFVALGQTVEVEITSLPSRRFSGQVAFIDPTLDEMTRTARIRVEVANEDGLLKPGMFGTATIIADLTFDGGVARPPLPGLFACPMHPLQYADQAGARCRLCGMEMKRRVPSRGKPPGKTLAVPREAVLSTGTRHLVYVEWWAKRSADGAVIHDENHRAMKMEQPQYQGFAVKLGPLAAEYHVEGTTRHKLGEYYPVIEGLPTGVRVVTNGQFLIDSQQELAGKPSLFRPQGGGAGGEHSGH
ncbi:MAG: efflux RND transporter periplasmic adaptor subunit [Planctomycetes bacterium]|nr:efflux RND transporter periplasmic adaptor subunit [Planctomycetota bacterium]